MAASARTWIRFRIRTLFIVVAFLAIGLGVWKNYFEIKLRRAALIRQLEQHDESQQTTTLFSRFAFISEESFKCADGKRYRLMLFDSVFKSWPGHNPYKIVVASENYELLQSGVFGGEEMYNSHSLAAQGNQILLKVTCVHRPMRGGVGTYSYIISPTEITESSGVEWVDASYWPRFFDALQSTNPKSEMGDEGVGLEN